MASVYEGKNESTSLEPKVHPSGDCEIMTESDTGSGNLEEEASKCVQPSKKPSRTVRIKSKTRPLKEKSMSKIEDIGMSTVLGVIANFVNSTIGAGIMGLPYAMSMTGFGFGIITYIIGAVMGYWGYILLLDSGTKMNRLNYDMLFKDIYGTWSVYNFMFTLYVNTIGTLTAYILLLGNAIPSLLGLFYGSNAFLDNSRYIMVIVVFEVLFPLSLYENMHNLVWISYISCTCIVLLWGMIIFTSPFENFDLYNDMTPENTIQFFKSTFIKGMGIQAYSLLCTSYSFLMYRSLKQPTMNSWKFVVTVSMSCICLVGFPLMLSGYLSFGDHTEADILENLTDTSFSAIIAHICLVVNIAFTFPVSLTQTINSTIYMDLFKMPDMTMSRHVFLTALNCSISLGICLITQDLGQVFNVIGSYTATMLGYIFPGFLYIGAYKNAFWDIINTWDKLSLWGKIFSLKSFYIPVLLIPYGTFIFVCGMLGIFT